MKTLGLRIKYIYHSGFTVEVGSRLLVFDYFRGNLDLPADKDIYVFSSHAHPDHFTPEILDWRKKRPDIRYILSSDIQTTVGSQLGQDRLCFMSPYENLQIGDIRVRTYGSTDAGVSYLVTCDGISIFHAGDLNWWYWWGETPAEIQAAEEMFKTEIAKIKGAPIDVAFFPVDSRLEHNYHLGGQYFIREIKPRVFIPMHFGSDLTWVRQFAADMKEEGSRIVLLTEQGQEIAL